MPSIFRNAFSSTISADSVHTESCDSSLSKSDASEAVKKAVAQRVPKNGFLWNAQLFKEYEKYLDPARVSSWRLHHSIALFSILGVLGVLGVALVVAVLCKGWKMNECIQQTPLIRNLILGITCSMLTLGGIAGGWGGLWVHRRFYEPGQEAVKRLAWQVIQELQEEVKRMFANYLNVANDSPDPSSPALVNYLFSPQSLAQVCLNLWYPQKRIVFREGMLIKEGGYQAMPKNFSSSPPEEQQALDLLMDLQPQVLPQKRVVTVNFLPEFVYPLREWSS